MTILVMSIICFLVSIVFSIGWRKRDCNMMGISALFLVVGFILFFNDLMFDLKKRYKTVPKVESYIPKVKYTLLPDSTVKIDTIYYLKKK